MDLKYYERKFLKLPFGEALKKLRFETEMTMDSLSESSGVSQSYISQLENGVRLPSDKVIDKIASAFARKIINIYLNDQYSDLSGEIALFYSSEKEVENKLLIETEEEAYKIAKILTQIKENDKTNVKELHNSDLSKEELKILTVYRNLSSEKKKSFLSMLDLLKD